MFPSFRNEFYSYIFEYQLPRTVFCKQSVQANTNFQFPNRCVSISRILGILQQLRMSEREYQLASEYEGRLKVDIDLYYFIKDKMLSCRICHSN